MEEVVYRRARGEDVKSLVELRAAFLAEVGGADANDPALLQALERYFAGAVPSGEFIAYLALSGQRVIACSGLVYHRHAPSHKNLTGIEGYVMNMFTVPAWRGRGIAARLLRELIAIAREGGCRRIRLHAFPKAMPIYTRADFVMAEGGMKLDLK